MLEGGIRALEFTPTNERALHAIGEVRDRLPDDAPVGAGKVLDAESAEDAVRAGARFLVTPVYRQEVTDRGREQGVP